MTESNCCFLSCMQISQEAGQVVWYSHLFQNFPQFIVIHTVKGFGIVSNADVFLELLLFLWSNGCWQFGFSSFSQSSLNIWKLLIHLLLKPSLKDFEHYLANMWNEHNLQWFEYFLALPLFRVGMKTDLFQSSCHCWVFQICWHIACCTLTASSFRIWNSLARILSPPLVLFVVIVP